MVMVLGLVIMALVLGLGAWLSGRCQTSATPERSYRHEARPGLVLYCGPVEGPLLHGCPWFFAGGGLTFIVGALWLGWREGRRDDEHEDA